MKKKKLVGHCPKEKKQKGGKKTGEMGNLFPLVTETLGGSKRGSVERFVARAELRTWGSVILIICFATLWDLDKPRSRFESLGFRLPTFFYFVYFRGTQNQKKKRERRAPSWGT